MTPFDRLPLTTCDHQSISKTTMPGSTRPNGFKLLTETTEYGTILENRMNRKKVPLRRDSIARLWNLLEYYFKPHNLTKETGKMQSETQSSNKTLLLHNAISTLPYHLWHKHKPIMSRIFAFGQLSTVPFYAPKTKLEPRADPARYLYPTSVQYIAVLHLRTSQCQHLRELDFDPYDKKSNSRHSKLLSSWLEQSITNPYHREYL